MKKHKPPLSVLNAQKPPAGLTRRIMVTIEQYERRMLFARRVGFGVCVAGSVALTGFGFENAAMELSRSGFFPLASLIFSDFSSTVANFPDFFFSVAESIPAIPIALFFGGIVFFLWSASQLSVNARAYQWSVLK